MTSFVLMSKRTGHLCEGHRILFADKLMESAHTINNGDWCVFMGPKDQWDGWLVCSTEAGGFSVFMNRNWVEKEFENLGAL